MMHQETELIVNAIESLRQESNFFRDYIFPIVSAFFTSLLGAAIAYFILRYQESIKIEKKKMDTVNKWILLADEARTNLVSIKDNYHGYLTDNPIQRALRVPPILVINEPIKEEYSSLSFLAPKLKPKPKQENFEYAKWSQIPRIRAMIHNYNLLFEIWIKRNQIDRKIKEELAQKCSQEELKKGISLEQLEKCDNILLVDFIDFTEKAVTLTDSVLIELDDFLSNFPSYAKTQVDTVRLKKYGAVLTYSNNDNQKLLNLLKKSLDTNYEPITNLFGLTVEQLQKRYS